MQFLTILLINILMGAIIYLLLSLKLAKTSSEYREQRFKREMDEIIKEFNITADRNISILENKINLVKKILQESGTIQGIDVTVGIEDAAGGEEKIICETEEVVEPDVPENKTVTRHIKKSLPHYLLNAIDIVREKIENVSKTSEKSEFNVDISSLTIDEGEKITDPYEKLIEKDLSSLNVCDINNKGRKIPHLSDQESGGGVTEEDILLVIKEGKDKFLTVAELERMGCSIEMIAQYCETPVGEIRLILNLQK